jgi:hypothetical protein
MHPMPQSGLLSLSLALSLTLTLALTPCAAGAAAEGAPCPDERATNIPGHEHLSQLTNPCLQSYTVVGLSITVGQRPCPSSIVLHPSHGECQGATSAGYRCIAQGFVTSFLRTCRCQDAATVVFGSSAQPCVCSDPLAFGVLQNHVTVECPPSVRVQS